MSGRASLSIVPLLVPFDSEVRSRMSIPSVIVSTVQTPGPVITFSLTDESAVPPTVWSPAAKAFQAEASDGLMPMAGFTDPNHLGIFIGQADNVPPPTYRGQYRAYFHDGTGIVDQQVVDPPVQPGRASLSVAIALNAG